jgi:prephenate dehydrogenase
MTTQPSPKVAIVGLGLIGTSLGLALKAGGLDAQVAGYDTDGGAARSAKKQGAIDVSASSPSDAVSGATLVLLAVPITAVRDALTAIAPHLAEGATVTDTASTKLDVQRWAAELLPEHASFVGGHPMAGKETPGAENADVGLFTGKPYCICPPVSAMPESVRSITGLANLVGAVPLYMDAAEHDQYVAAVSHMPLMVSTALFSLIRGSGSWDDIGAVAGPAFRDMTRLASGDPGMALGIWRTNREALIHWLERMTGELSRYRDLLNDAQDEKLLELFTEAQLKREEFLANPPARQPEAAVEVDRGKALMDMLIGARLADNLRRGMPEEKPMPGDKEPRFSIGERIAEGVKRDLEKLEAKEQEGESGDTGQT